jgi:transposase
MQARETLFGPEPVAEASVGGPSPERKRTARERQLTAKVKPIDRSQSLWVPLDVEELIGPDHAARAIWELTGKLDLQGFYEPIVSAEGRAGRRGWDPRLLLSVWLYAYSKGESSARAIASQMSYEPALMWLAGLGEVNHDRLSEFRRNHKEALDELFVQLLTVMQEEGLVDLNQVMHDGTKIRAQAGVDSFRRQATLEQRLAEARELVKKFDDCEDEAGSRRRQAARERAARERVERLELAMQQLQAVQAAKKEADQAEVRVSLTEPEARRMKHGDNAIAPSYNLQISTDAKQKVIVGAHLTQQSSDSNSLGQAMDVVVDNLGRAPEQVVADGGYTNCDTIVEMAARQIDFVGSMSDRQERQAAALKASGIEAGFGSAFFIMHPESRSLECPAGKPLAYVRQSKKRGNLYHQYQASGSDCQACVHRQQCCPKNPGRGRTVSVLKSEREEVVRFRQKMQSEEARQIYRKRGPVAEFPNAWIKEKLKVRKFRLRGLAKASTEALWACLTYNVMQWIRLTWRPAAIAQPEVA